MIARVALLLALASAALSAQAVRGRVLQADSAGPASGVLIAVSDARGTEIARAVSNERGEFLLALPGAGRFNVRALRVGYPPTAVPPVSVASGDTAFVRIVLARDLVRLSASPSVAPTTAERATRVARGSPMSGRRLARRCSRPRRRVLAARSLPHGSSTTDRSTRPAGGYSTRSCTCPGARAINPSAVATLHCSRATATSSETPRA